MIATGFKESDVRHLRRHENSDPVIMSRHHERFHVPEPEVEPEPAMEREPAFEPDMPVAFQTAAPASQPHAEVISLDGMRTASPSYTPEDLDVPAFLRKRNEVM